MRTATNSFLDNIKDSGKSLDDQLFEKACPDILAETMRQVLTEREVKIVRLHFVYNLTYETIGELCPNLKTMKPVSRARIEQLVKCALGKLQQSPQLRELIAP